MLEFIKGTSTFQSSMDSLLIKWFLVITGADILELTHWGRVMHICVGNLASLGPDNGLLPGRRQAIIWTDAGILLIGPLGTNFSEILIDIHTFSFTKMHLKMSSTKWRPFCLGLNVSTCGQWDIDMSVINMNLLLSYDFFSLQVLICRNYRGDIDMSVIDKFMPLVMEREEEATTAPIIQHGNVTFIYIKYNNLYCILPKHCCSQLRIVGCQITGNSTASSIASSGWRQTIIKAPYYWPFVRGIQRIPLTKGQ